MESVTLPIISPAGERGGKLDAGIYGCDNWTNFQLNHMAYFKIIPDSTKDLEWYFDVISYLGILMTLLIGIPICAIQDGI
jgi:hypothetical protein